MNITKENVDDLNAVLKIKIDKEDYDARVDEVLKEYRRKIKMDGFRPGKVPQGLIKKFYKKPVLVEEINKIISESISKYLENNNIKILGEPLPKKENQNEIDWDNQTQFEFEFDLGLAPELDIQVSRKDKIPRYEIQVDDQMIEETKDNYCRRLGTYIQIENIEGNEIAKGRIVQINKEGQIIEEGISKDDTMLSIGLIKDESIKKQFLGKKAGDYVAFDVKKAFPIDQEAASILGIDKSKIPEIAPNFGFTIKDVLRFEKAEINQELFDKIYGKGQIKTQEEFTEKIVEEIKGSLDNESKYRFALDVRNTLLKKVKFDLPVEFLKKWLMLANKGKFTKEQLEQDFPKFEDDLKWQLIKDQIIKKQELKVTDDELFGYARLYALAQFRQYGMANVPETNLQNYANEILNNENEKKKIYEKLYEDQVIKYVSENINVDYKKITVEKFNKLYEK